MMNTLIAQFPEQLSEAIQIGEQAGIRKPTSEIRQVLVCGLGGSGIGAEMVRQLTENQLSVPFLINKTYDIPAFVSEHTLLIISSYSGNTEETLEAFQKAIPKNPKIIGISSNGKVEEICSQNKYDLIKVPGNMPPRSCLGYSMVLQLYILHALGCIDASFKDELKTSIDLLQQQQEKIKEKSQQLAQHLVNKTLVIYSSDRFEAVSVRYRQQINENSKMLCWHHVFPEMNHNELVGWRNTYDQLAVLLLRSKEDYYRTQKRMEFSKDVFRACHANIFEIEAMGESLIQQTLYLVHFGDWLSYYLAECRKVDAVEVKVIDKLKQTLAEIQ